MFLKSASTRLQQVSFNSKFDFIKMFFIVKKKDISMKIVPVIFATVLVKVRIDF